ncbi:hypothetical protein PR048_015171 [Dryococelus australis]|uniref:Uncharacterized protein n=1 Tax=Dryococelus australis TaxID=614101 RepID=A0ABQ9HH72_9NEOP|nr:hypothetical protein PR048_015171 [Dryococelus australis]
MILITLLVDIGAGNRSDFTGSCTTGLRDKRAGRTTADDSRRIKEKPFEVIVTAGKCGKTSKRSSSGMQGRETGEPRENRATYNNAFRRIPVRLSAGIPLGVRNAKLVTTRGCCGTPTKANRVQSPAGSSDFLKWESCRTMPLVSGFSGASVAERLDYSPPTKVNRVQSPASSLHISQVGIAPDDSADRRVVPGISHFSTSFIPTLLHIHLTSPSLALKTSLNWSSANPEPRAINYRRSGRCLIRDVPCRTTLSCWQCEVEGTQAIATILGCKLQDTSHKQHIFGRILTSRSSEPTRVIEVNMERRRNEGAVETGDPREYPRTNGIVRHDSISGVCLTPTVAPRGRRRSERTSERTSGNTRDGVPGRAAGRELKPGAGRCVPASTLGACAVSPSPFLDHPSPPIFPLPPFCILGTGICCFSMHGLEAMLAHARLHRNAISFQRDGPLFPSPFLYPIFPPTLPYPLLIPRVSQEVFFSPASALGWGREFTGAWSRLNNVAGAAVWTETSTGDSNRGKRGVPFSPPLHLVAPQVSCVVTPSPCSSCAVRQLIQLTLAVQLMCIQGEIGFNKRNPANDVVERDMHARSRLVLPYIAVTMRNEGTRKKSAICCINEPSKRSYGVTKENRRNRNNDSRNGNLTPCPPAWHCATSSRKKYRSSCYMFKGKQEIFSISNNLSNSAQASWESQWEQRISAEVGREREVWWSEQQWAKVSVGDGPQRSAGSERRSEVSGPTVAEWLYCLTPTNTNRVYLRLVHSGFSQVGVEPDDASGRRVFSGLYCFPSRFIPVLLHTHLGSPSSALKTLMYLGSKPKIVKDINFLVDLGKSGRFFQATRTDTLVDVQKLRSYIYLEAFSRYTVKMNFEYEDMPLDSTIMGSSDPHHRNLIVVRADFAIVFSFGQNARQHATTACAKSSFCTRKHYDSGHV